MVARLPIPGGDEGNWGQILNEYLSVAHNIDGALKPSSIGEAQLNAAVQAKLNAVAGPSGQPGATGPDGTPGPTGATGAVGATGPQGPVGSTGPIGPQGGTGSVGATGPQGASGQNGSDATVNAANVGAALADISSTNLVAWSGSSWPARPDVPWPITYSGPTAQQGTIADMRAGDMWKATD